jgi:hypothetical protein
MIASINRPTMVLGTTLGATVLGGVSGETVQTIAIIAGFTAAVITGFAWLDARFDRKIKAHAEAEKELARARNDALLAQIQMMISEKVAEGTKLRALGD